MIYAMEYDPFWKPESWSQGNLVTDNVKAIRLGTPQEFLILLRNIKTLGYGIHCWRERPVAFWWH